jgi:hypothetical protein
MGTQASTLGDSWQEPDVSLANSVDLPQLTGCNRLSFSPVVRVTSGALEAGEPSSYNVQLEVPQSEDATSLATGEVESAKIALPAGVSLSPLALGSLGGCTEAQIALQSNGAGSCPGTSQIGFVRIETSLLAEPLIGHMYLAAQDANPRRSLRCAVDQGPRRGLRRISGGRLVGIQFLFAIQALGLLGAERPDLRRECPYCGRHPDRLEPGAAPRGRRDLRRGRCGYAIACVLPRGRTPGPIGDHKPLCHGHYNMP